MSCIGGLGGNIDIPRVGLYNTGAGQENKLGLLSSQENRDKVMIELFVCSIMSSFYLDSQRERLHEHS